MAPFCLCRGSAASHICFRPALNPLRTRYLQQYPRFLQTSNPQNHTQVPNFAFAFEYNGLIITLLRPCLQIRSIDGVLLRSSKPLPRAHRALSYLQTHRIPFILLTNGGGKTEQERVQQLSQLLEVHLDTSMFVQSHTPFAELAKAHAKGSLKEKCILVVGGEGDKCRRVAEG